jgi:hypothetical protein
LQIGVELIDVTRSSSSFSSSRGGGGTDQLLSSLSSITNKMMWRFAVASDPDVERY